MLYERPLDSNSIAFIDNKRVVGLITWEQEQNQYVIYALGKEFTANSLAEARETTKHQLNIGLYSAIPSDDLDFDVGC